MVYQRLWTEPWKTPPIGLQDVRRLGSSRVWMTAALLAAGAVAVGVLGYFYGYLRAALGVAMFVAILIAGVRFVRQMVIAPPEPEVTDVSGYGLKYVCENCGLELRVEKAAQDRPPRHCSEAMTLVREGGKPPLRPV